MSNLFTLKDNLTFWNPNLLSRTIWHCLYMRSLLSQQYWPQNMLLEALHWKQHLQTDQQLAPTQKKLAVLQPGFKHIIMFHPPLRGGLSHASHCLESLISFPLIQWLYSSLFHLPQHLRHGPACPLGKLIWWNPANYILLTSSCLVSPSVRCLRVESFKYPGYTLDTAAYMASPRWALAIPRGGSPIEQTFEFVYWLSIL